MSTSRQSVDPRKHAPPEELAVGSPGFSPDQISVPKAYEARILKLRLPEQDKIKNASERCSVDLTTLRTIGRKRGEQIRIKRKDDARFVALYTVKQANPDTGPASADGFIQPDRSLKLVSRYRKPIFFGNERDW
jgi:hypothetical protein